MILFILNLHRAVTVFSFTKPRCMRRCNIYVIRYTLLCDPKFGPLWYLAFSSRCEGARTMAGDMLLLMRGLAKLSQAVIETQANALRSGGSVAQSMQMTA